MTALLAPEHPALHVIEGGRKRGRPSKEDVATLELAMRRSEEQEQADAILPALRRLELVAHEYGPVAFQVYAAIANWHRRHTARWADEDEGSVA